MFGSQVAKDIELPGGHTDGVSCLKFSPKGNFLVGGSWDKMLKCWEITGSNTAVGKAAIDYEASVLCTDWSPDCTKVYAGGVDNKVKCWNLQTNQWTQVAQHAGPVKECFWIEESNILVTGSWDKTVKYWDTRSPTPALSVDVPDRVYALDVMHPLLVVGTADRKVLIYNLTNPGVEFKNGFTT
eukprot:gene10268-11976_t